MAKQEQDRRIKSEQTGWFQRLAVARGNNEPSDDGSSVDFLFIFAEIFNDARATTWFARNTGITPVKDEPVMAIHFKRGRDHFQKLLFNLLDIFPGGELGAVADAKDMGIYCDCRSSERRV